MLKLPRLRYGKLFSIILLGLFSNASLASDSYLEISQSVDSNTLNKVHTLGLYGFIDQDHRERVYAGLQLALFDTPETSGNDSVYRVFLGVELKTQVSPFFEIGTDLLGFFVNKDEDEICDKENDCKLDFFVRLGVRVRLSQQYTLGIYHEDVNFGDFHSQLEGDHNFTGVSLGMFF